MQISNEMKQYNIIGERYRTHLVINEDLVMALVVAREISAYLMVKKCYHLLNRI